MGLTQAAKEGVYLKNLMNELSQSKMANITIYNDNLCSIKLAGNPWFHNRSKLRPSLYSGRLKK